jgi:hypothetical protein
MLLALPPLTLYRGTVFRMMMKHAQQRCDAIVIVSAKYGLLGLRSQVAYYDTYLPDLDQQQRATLVTVVEAQLPTYIGHREPVLSYLPEAYASLPTDAVKGARVQPNIRRPYKGIRLLTLLQILSNEIKHYG